MTIGVGECILRSMFHAPGFSYATHLLLSAREIGKLGEVNAAESRN